MSDLKPCPFCGSSDVGGASGIISCYRCPAEISVQNTNTHYAAELWNNRAARAQQPNLSRIAQKKLDQMGATVHGVLVKNGAGAWVAVSDAGRVMWLDGFEGQAARQAPASGEVEPVGMFGLSAFEVKAVAMELHRAADEMSDNDNDYALDLVICESVTEDDGSILGGPMLCVRDSEYPEEGVYPVPASQQTKDRYTHPPAKVPEVPTEEMLIEGVEVLIRGLKAFPDNYTQIVNNIWEDMAAFLLTTPTPATTPQPVDEGCEWHGDDNGTWMSACGKEWYFEDGGPEDNGMNFCVKCGNRCVEIGSSEDGGEDYDSAM